MHQCCVEQTQCLGMTISDTVCDESANVQASYWRSFQNISRTNNSKQSVEICVAHGSVETQKKHQCVHSKLLLLSAFLLLFYNPLCVLRLLRLLRLFSLTLCLSLLLNQRKSSFRRRTCGSPILLVKKLAFKLFQKNYYFFIFFIKRLDRRAFASRFLFCSSRSSTHRRN